MPETKSMIHHEAPIQSLEFDADHHRRLLGAFAGLTEQMSRASSRDEVLSLAATWVPNIFPADRANITFPVGDEDPTVHALEGNKAIPIGLSPLRTRQPGRLFAN